jgi:sulfur carrier protein
MRVIVNQIEHEVPQGSLVSQVLEQVQAKPPFAVAVNLRFLPKTQYTEYTLQENDQIEVIAPVTGG